MQLAAHVFSFGEPGATGRLLGEWMVWSIGLAMVVAWLPRRSLQLNPMTHVALIAVCLSMAILSGFWHATGYFYRIAIDRDGDVSIGYDEPKYREQVLPYRDVDAIEVGASRTLGASSLCRLVIVSNGWKHSSVEDECRAVERARDVLWSAVARR